MLRGIDASHWLDLGERQRCGIAPHCGAPAKDMKHMQRQAKQSQALRIAARTVLGE